MQCPKCRSENAENAKFCSNCGKRIDGKETCPSCGHECDAKASFCEACGKQLKKEDPSSSQEKPKTNKKDTKNKLSQIFNIILSIASIVFLGLSIPLMFGDYFTTSDGDVYSFFRLVSLLSSGDNPYSTSSVPGQLYDLSHLITSIVILVILLAYAILMIILSIKGIIKEAKALKQKEQSNSDKYIMGELLVSYLVNSLVKSYAEPSSTQGICISLILVFGTILIVLKLAYRLVFTFKKDAGHCFASYICIVMVFLQSLSLLGNIADSYLTVYDGNLLTSEGFFYSFSSTLTMVGTLNSLGYTSVGDANGIVAIASITMGISFACMVVIAVVSYLISENIFDSSISKKPIVLASLAVGFSALNCASNAILALDVGSMLKASGYEFFIGSSSISSILLSALMLGGAIASYQLRKKAAEIYRL